MSHLLSSGGLVPAAQLSFTTRFSQGLGLTWTSVAGFTVAAGKARDSADTINMTLAAGTAVTFADLDAGVEAAGWYFPWLMSMSNGVSVVKLSLSSTAPTMGAYTHAKRLTPAVRNSAALNLYRFWTTDQGGSVRVDWLEDYSTTNVLSAGAAVVFTPVSCAAFAPPTSFLVGLQMYVGSAAPLSTAGRATLLRTAGTTVTLMRQANVVVINATPVFETLEVSLPTNASQQVDYLVCNETRAPLRVLPDGRGRRRTAGRGRAQHRDQPTAWG